QLWIVAAGPPQALQRCGRVLDAMGQGVIVAGDDPPRANVIKLAGNFLLAAAIEAMGEAFALARKYGVAPAELLDIVNGRLFRSPIAGITVTSSPSCTGAAKPPRNRTSSSFK